MQRTQIYFEQETIEELKNIAKKFNISVSEFIRQAVKREIKKNKEDSLSEFLSHLKPLQSFKDIDANDYVSNIRNNSRILNG
jgi:metal-responsive CopG/Arc/MetJ family transcriptional regulator